MSSYIDVVSVDGWNEKAIGECVIDGVEVENARLALSRALGLPEPVLYDDIQEDEWGELIELFESECDWERILWEVIDLQERMSNGMKMIRECEEVLSSARAGKRIPKEAFLGWINRQKKLWNHWRLLRDQCKELVGENSWIWRKYFDLCEESPDRSGYTEDDIHCPDWIMDIYTGARWLDDSVDDYEG
jgi:hypothetical protein